MVALVNGVAPLVAPLLGALVLSLAGWRAIHASLGAVGGALLLLAIVGYAETAPWPVEAARRSVLGAALEGYRTVLRDRGYLASTGLLAATFGVMFSYITGSSAVFMDQLGASPTAYSLLFACTACGTMVGAASNARLSRRVGAPQLLAIAVVGNVVVAGLLLLVALRGAGTIALTAALVVLSNVCAGVIMPTATHAGLRRLGHVAGSASALQRCLQMVAASIFGSLAGLLGGNPLVAMATAMVIASLLAAGCWQAARRVASRAAAASPVEVGRAA